MILENVVCFMFTAIGLLVKAAALFPVRELNTDGGAQKILKGKLWPDCTSFQKTAPVSSVSSAAATLRAISSPQAQLRVKKNSRCLHTTHGGDKYPAGYPHDTGALFWLFLPAIKMINCVFFFFFFYLRRPVVGGGEKGRKKEKLLRNRVRRNDFARRLVVYNRLKEMSAYFSSRVMQKNNINVECCSPAVVELQFNSV